MRKRRTEMRQGETKIMNEKGHDRIYHKIRKKLVFGKNIRKEEKVKCY